MIEESLLQRTIPISGKLESVVIDRSSLNLPRSMSTGNLRLEEIAEAKQSGDEKFTIPNVPDTEEKKNPKKISADGLEPGMKPPPVRYKDSAEFSKLSRSAVTLNIERDKEALKKKLEPLKKDIRQASSTNMNLDKMKADVDIRLLTAGNKGYQNFGSNSTADLRASKLKFDRSKLDRPRTTKPEIEIELTDKPRIVKFNDEKEQVV